MADYLARAAQTAAQFSKRFSETVAETTRDLAFDAGTRYLETAEDRLQDLAQLLGSRYDREQLEGLKRLVALISKGWNVAEFFPHVVKLVASRNLDVRKLVYIYLLRYAAQEPDLSLLSVNTFQKDLGDANQFIRAMALRVMTGIRVPAIAPLLVLGVRKCASDSSPYVRKTAALAIAKCALLDPTRRADLIDILVQLLHDRSSLVIGSVMTAYSDLCPERIDLLHQHFRRLCRMLADADEWGQIAILEVLTRYARTQFTDPQHIKSSNSESNTQLDPDHKLLLEATAPLLYHRNSAVIITAISLFFYIGTQDDIAKISQPLGRLLHGSREIQYTVLMNIKPIIEKRPEVFADSVKSFYLRVTDPVIIGQLKLDMLTQTVNDSTAQGVVDELFVSLCQIPSKELTVLAVKAIGQFVKRQPTYTNVCLRHLMHLYRNDNECLAGEAAAATRQILLHQTEYISIDNMKQYIIYLIGIFFDTQSSVARANIVWLISHYCLRQLATNDLTPLPLEVANEVVSYAPNILRELTRKFIDEDTLVKLQALRLGLVMALTGEATEKGLFLHLLELARYDLNYDVRDCARWIRGIATNQGITKDGHDDTKKKDDAASEQRIDELVHPISFHWYRYIGSFTSDTEKKTAIEDVTIGMYYLQVFGAIGIYSCIAIDNPYIIGSMSRVINQSTAGYEPLPDWPIEQPDPAVRGAPVSSRNRPLNNRSLQPIN
ncbi:adaptin N terminal region-domain-containing protein [Syncephalis fuscata]|nr:adaptin N terminal region-domain-containing protein [Syncephalis fuscata]